MKHLGINLTKHIQDLYEENYKTLTKVKELNKWEIILFVNRKSFVKMSFLPNLIYRFNAISKLQQVTIFAYQPIDSKVYVKTQKSQNSHHNVEGEEQLEGRCYTIELQ